MRAKYEAQLRTELAETYTKLDEERYAHEELRCNLRRVVEEYKWLYHEGESLRALYLKLEKLTGGDAIEQDK